MTVVTSTSARPVARVDHHGGVTPEPTDLLGTWTLQRQVDDRLGGEVRAVEGSATLALVADGHVRWSEEGTMRWSGGEVPVSRTLDVVRRDAGWVVLFADGREFHQWSVGAPVDHPCGADHYRGLVDMPGPDRWRVTWVVRGPAKDYTMVTEHTDRREALA